MESEQIRAELRAFVVRDLLAGNAEGLEDDTPLLEWGIIESFSLVRLVNHISHTFGVELPFSMITPKNFESVAAIADAIAGARSAIASSKPAPAQVEQRQALVQRTPGVLDGFEWQPIPDQAPADDQIEIEVRAAGVNFRDVMIALGVYPEGGAAPGRPGECSGVVRRIGSAQRSFASGDEVVAIVEGDAHGAFADRVVTDARLVARKPAELSFAAAATLPIAFLTAHHALRVLARVGPGERVLVHSAAGACGLAAVQLALAAGAEVLATVGDPAKSATLAALGVRHIFDNRSLAFADDVLAATAGRGVDIVLNSLPGPYIAKGLSLLAPFGRFIELGKTAIHANASIGLAPFRNNQSYFAIDLVPILHDRPAAVGDFLAGLMNDLSSDVLHPLPHTLFRFEDAGEALSCIARRKNIGKLVLSTINPQKGS